MASPRITVTCEHHGGRVAAFAYRQPKRGAPGTVQDDPTWRGWVPVAGVKITNLIDDRPVSVGDLERFERRLGGAPEVALNPGDVRQTWQLGCRQCRSGGRTFRAERAREVLEKLYRAGLPVSVQLLAKAYGMAGVSPSSNPPEGR